MFPNWSMSEITTHLNNTSIAVGDPYGGGSGGGSVLFDIENGDTQDNFQHILSVTAGLAQVTAAIFGEGSEQHQLQTRMFKAMRFIHQNFDTIAASAGDPETLSWDDLQAFSTNDNNADLLGYSDLQKPKPYRPR